MLINFDGKRPRGRPKKRWADQVREDMRNIGATGQDVFDRVRWRRLCMENIAAKKKVVVFILFQYVVIALIHNRLFYSTVVSVTVGSGHFGVDVL